MQQSFVVLQVCRHLSSNHLSFACPRASLLTLLSFVVNGENICYARIQTSRAVSSKCALCQNTKKMPNSSHVRMIKLSVSHQSYTFNQKNDNFGKHWRPFFVEMLLMAKTIVMLGSNGQYNTHSQYAHYNLACSLKTLLVFMSPHDYINCLQGCRKI